MYLLTLVAAAVCLVLNVLSVNAIPPLTIKGTKFFNAEGEQVFFKGFLLSFEMIKGLGVAYQRATPHDPFANATQCQLDADLMKSLGANAIRCISSPELYSYQLIMSILRMTMMRV